MKKTISKVLLLFIDAMILLTACSDGAATNLKGTGAEIPVMEREASVLPESDGLDFVKQLKLGWNLGNALDADANYQNEEASETAWGSPVITEEMILSVKNAGFNTVRIPVTWHNHMDESFKISEYWLGRVREIVDYAYKNGMYVILNAHHDTNEAYCYPTYETLDSSKAYLTALWTQVCETFKDYDEHLIFESINEPRLIGTDNEWWIDTASDLGKEAIDCVMQFNQTFVDTVRASGGNNAERWLMTPSYCASCNYACDDLFSLADDPASRTIVSVHAYEPQSFALDGGGADSFMIRRNSVVVDDVMQKLYDKFTSKGIPVVIGEFGARDKDNLESRITYGAYYVAAARAVGISCLWWDNNAFEGNGELFGLLDRKTMEWKFPDIVLAMLENCQ